MLTTRCRIIGFYYRGRLAGRPQEIQSIRFGRQIAHARKAPKSEEAPVIEASFEETRPIRLVSSQQSDHTYLLSFETGATRGSSLSEPFCSVLVCLIGEERTGSLHRISPIADDSSRRFLQGSTDTVQISCPDLGALTGILIGLESGKWNLDRLVVTDSATGTGTTFVCQKTLGTAEEPAVYLVPLLDDHILYGSGPKAVQLTKEEAFEILAEDLDDYHELKRRILKVNAVLLVIGVVIETKIFGPVGASVFAAGGFGGMGYQYLLQRSVDTIGRDVELVAKSDVLSRLFSSPVSRVLFTVILGALVYRVLQSVDQTTDSVYRGGQILNFAFGLLMFKAAIAYVALTSDRASR